MANIDRFLAVLVGNKATSLLLSPGEVVRVTVGDTPRPITKQPLTAQQLLALLREVAPADAVPAQLLAADERERDLQPLLLDAIVVHGLGDGVGWVLPERHSETRARGGESRRGRVAPVRAQDERAPGGDSVRVTRGGATRARTSPAARAAR